MLEEEIIDSNLMKYFKTSTAYKVFDDKNCERKQPYEENSDILLNWNFYSKSLNEFLFDSSFNFTNTSKHP